MIENEENSGTKKEVDVDTEIDNAKDEEDKTNTKKEDVGLDTEKFNAIIQERLDRANKAFLKKYGVSSTEELDKLLGKAENSDVLSTKYEKLSSELNELKTEKLLNSHDVRADRADDIKYYFKGKGIELNKDNLEKELAVHKEWSSKSPYLDTLGSEKKDEKPEESEKEAAERYYGIKF